MFGSVRNSNNATAWANFNYKTGLFVIDHKEQNAEQTFRKHVTTNNRVVYKEEHEAVKDVFVRRVMVMEQPNYDDRTKMDKVIGISVRGADGNDAVLKFSMGQFAVKVLGLLRSADLTKPITLAGGAFAEGTKKTNLSDGSETVRTKAEAFLVGYQGGQKLVASFSDNPDFKIPKVEKIEVKNPATGAVLQTVSDPTNRDNFTLELAKEMTKKAEEAIKSQNAPSQAAQKQDLPAPTSSDAEVGISAADVLGVGDGGQSDAEQFAAPAAT